MLCTQIPSIHMHAHTLTPHHGCLPLVPQNMEAAVDPKQASVRLKWDPPFNFKMLSGGTKYQLRFKPEQRSHYDQETMATSHVSVARNSGLQASKMHRFEVRAENAEAAGEWNIYSAYIGRFMCIEHWL